MSYHCSPIPPGEVPIKVVKGNFMKLPLESSLIHQSFTPPLPSKVSDYLVD